MTEFFFTVIVPTYNRSELLRQTLKSLEQQNFKNFEVFILDDASTDDTYKVFDEFKDLKGWYFVRFSKNRGQAYLRNFAIKLSSGRWITFLDSDDIWLPDRLSKFYEKINHLDDNDIGFIFSNGYILHENVITGTFFGNRINIPRGKLEPYMAISNKWLPYVTTNVVIPKSVFYNVGFFRTDMSHLEDMELYVRILKKYKVDYISEPLSVYRIQYYNGKEKSLTQKWEKGIEDFITALNTASPPENIKKELEDYVYYNQALVYVKNFFRKEARSYFKKLNKKNIKVYILLLLTYVPVFILKVLRWLYRLFKKIKFIKQREYLKIYEYINECK